jgi:hypothetical protein
MMFAAAGTSPGLAAFASCEYIWTLIDMLGLSSIVKNQTEVAYDF